LPKRPNRKSKRPDVGFGDRLKELMAEKGIGVAELAKEIPVDPNSVTRWRRGHLPGELYLQKVARVLDTTTGFLTGDATSDPESWPAGHVVGHKAGPESSGAPSTTTYSNPDTVNPDDPAPRRPPQPQLPEPVFASTDGPWPALRIVYEAFSNDVKALEAAGADAMNLALVKFWGNRLVAAAQQDEATAKAAPSKPNGLHSAG
jgi:transcriptional regulator with XRE-family HTH domain